MNTAARSAKHCRSSSDVAASLMVTTGAKVGGVVICDVMSVPLGQYTTVIPEAPPPSRHNRKIRRQLLEYVGHDRRRHALGATTDRRRRNAVAAQDAPRIDPATLVGDLAHVHATVIRAVQAVQANARVPPLHFGDDALEAPAVVDLGIEGALDLVAHAGFGDGELDQRLARLGRQELVAGREVVDGDVGLVGLLQDLEAVLQPADLELALAERVGMYPGHERRMDDHLLQAALLDGPTQNVEMGIVERIEGAEEQADAALRRRHRSDVRQQADTEEHDAEHEARDQERLTGSRNAGSAERGQHEIDRHADQHVAVGVADAALEKIEADILGALRRERGNERRRSNAAHRRETVAVKSPSPVHNPEHRQVERILRDKTPQPAARYEAEPVVGPQFGLVAELGVARKENPDKD